MPLSAQAFTAIFGNICWSTKQVVPVRIISMIESMLPQYASSGVSEFSIGEIRLKSHSSKGTSSA